MGLGFCSNVVHNLDLVLFRIGWWTHWWVPLPFTWSLPHRIRSGTRTIPSNKMHFRVTEKCSRERFESCKHQIKSWCISLSTDWALTAVSSFQSEKWGITGTNEVYWGAYQCRERRPTAPKSRAWFRCKSPRLENRTTDGRRGQEGSLKKSEINKTSATEKLSSKTEKKAFCNDLSHCMRFSSSTKKLTYRQ